jgi:glucosamine--fructose-6-phosphate aminotransferase (isomerizing)
LTTTHFATELREQPEVLRRLLADGRRDAESIAAVISRRGVGFGVLAARGSSDNAARYGQYLLGIENSLLAALATPSLFTHYHATPGMADALVIGISQSGRSPDVVAVLAEARRQGAITVAVVNETDSPLAAAAELVFPLRCGAERSVGATKTYTAQLMALAMLSAAMQRSGARWQDLATIPEHVARTIELYDQRGSAGGLLGGHDRMIVVGRGFNLSTAFEISLKLKEAAGIMADGYSSADFFHGPRAMLDRSVPVLAVAPGPRIFAELDETARLAADAGAPLVVISERPDILARAAMALPLPAGIPDWLSPIVSVVPGQRLALELSLARGLNPDLPRGLSKITETR